MRLKRLEIYGFKSFAQRTVIDFVDGLTAIIGPNGSGKSNVSDAVRWVLGEQSAKSLRGSNMQDVIFSGTEKRKPLSTCEVTLVFDNEDKSLPIEYSEVAVTRRAYRSGDNEYLINKKQCRLKDITELFHDTGVGKEGYSIIGQGSLNDILSNRSEDRRIVLEEAAGITKYKTRKTEAERKLEHTSNNIIRMDDILEELALQLEPLKEQSEEARKYFALREELKEKELNIFLRQQDRGTERIKQLKENIDALSEQYKQMADMEADLSTSEIEARIREEDRQISQISVEVTSLSAKIERMQGEGRLVSEKTENALKEETRLLEELEAIESSRRTAKNTHIDILARDENLKNETSMLKQQVEKEELSFQTFGKELNTLEAELEHKKTQLIEVMNKLGDAKSKHARLEAMRQGSNQRLADMAESILGAETEAKSLNAEKQEYLHALEQLIQRRNNINSQIGEKQAHFQNINEKIAEAKAGARKLENAINTAKSALNMFIDMRNHYEGYAHSVKKVLEAALVNPAIKRSVDNVVASVIKAPKELETAIELSIGGALQNIITPTEQDAKLIIEFLRNNNLGRATFMPLSAVKGRSLNKAERDTLRAEGILGVASELIGYHRKYEGVIQSLLGRTVVARDLDTGIALMKKNNHTFRVVTLKGDMLLPGGTMTGGSINAKTAGLLSRDRNIEDTRAKIAGLEKQLEALTLELTQHQRQLTDLLEQQNTLKDHLHVLDIDIAREREKLENVEAYVKKSRQTLEKLNTEASQLKDNIQDIEQQLEDMEKAKHLIEDTNVADSGQIRQYQLKVNGMRSQRESMSDALTQQKIKLTGLEKELLSNESERLRIEKELAHMDLQQQQKQALLEGARKLMLEIANSSDDFEQQQKDGLVQLEELRSLLKQHEQNKRSLMDELESIGDKRTGLSKELNDILNSKSKAEMQLYKLETDMVTAANRIWEEYELTYAGAEEYRNASLQYQQTTRDIGEIRAAIREMGDINPRAMEEYESVKTRHAYLTNQREDLQKAHNNLNQLIEELMLKMQQQFKEQMALINENFKQAFVKLFGGGKASIKILGDDVLQSPIEIEAQPPGKKLQTLSLLSGGEKSLVAIALLFGILELRPAPFCILDEVDTALDEVNVDRFAEYVKQYENDLQFILITHRKNSMAACDALFGVVMEEKGISKIVSAKMSEAV